MSHTEVFQKRFEKVELFTSSDGRGGEKAKIDKAHVLLPGLVKNCTSEIKMIFFVLPFISSLSALSSSESSSS